MACPCCNPQDVCCCDYPWGPKKPNECTSTTSPLTSPRPTLSQISILVDWDGLSVLLEQPYFGTSASEDVSFSCLLPGASEAFNATSRFITANANVYNTANPNKFSYGSNSGCWVSPFYSITGGFLGTYPSTGFFVSGQNTVYPFVGECKLTDEVTLNTPANGWCDDNPYGPITVEMIIAP